ncbi:MAG TPA: metal ABC transporter substrate-binding protein [Anaerolineales bacterium]|nr:metal ABC transporter substrate-binding protein [Anaerolineales bacterium]HRK87869.1 metal ABC transporter substrate-binding protein [Anaerolineales bacterium]
MKKKLLSIVSLLTLLGLLLAACGGARTDTAQEPAVEGSAIKVLASTTFLADIAQNVAGDRAVVESLLPFGADPHSYQAAPTDVATIAESNVLILNGVEYEHFIEPLLENADGERLVIEAATGIEPRQMEEHSHEGEDHSPETHSREVCEQLEGKTAEEEIQTGADAASAVELHGEGEHAEGEHAHEREIVTLKLNAQTDGTFAGYVLFDSEEEQGYAITSAAGEIVVTDAAGATLEAGQTLTVDCEGMTVGSVYKLPVGEYVVAIMDADAENVAFSAAPMHAHEEGEEHAHEEGEEHAEGEEHDHEGEEGHEGHDHSAGDPHMWLDPNLVITYVENIRDGLSEADPEGAETYKANADAYIAQLQELDAFIKEQVESIPAERRLLVTNHEAMGYFAERYGFEVVDTIIPSLSTEASASAQEVAASIEAIKASGAPAIFLGEVENADLADQIAAETGAKVVSGLYLETLTDGEPAATYIEMMKYNVTQIVEGLK